MRRSLIVVCVLLVTLPLVGCLFTRHSSYVVREKEIERQVQFENRVAQQVFEDRARNPADRMTATKANVVAIPFLLWWSSTKELSPAAWYNDQITSADSNHDSVISEDEALAYNPNFGQEVEVDQPLEETVELEGERPIRQTHHTRPARQRSSQPRLPKNEDD